MRYSFGRKITWLLGASLLVLFGFILGSATLQSRAASQPIVSEANLQTVQARPPITENERYFADIYNRVSSSVVSISVTGRSVQGRFAASGTGFVIDTDGHIVTNNHVVDNASTIEVHFLDGTIAAGEVVGLDPDSDLAVLKVSVPADRLHPVPLGDSDALFIGETTLAIGNPFGQDWTLTTGVISALGRTIQGLTQYSVGSVIQTDAALNPGNSGGPLLNLDGQVIGVNSQINTESGSNAGIGFAIPINLVKRVVPELIANGRVDYSYLGISSSVDISLDLMDALHLPDNIRGVVVTDIPRNSPAALAGLQAPRGTRQTITGVDIITAIDGTPVHNMSDLVSYLSTHTKPGQTVTLSVWRDGSAVNVTVTLGSRSSA